MKTNTEESYYKYLSYVTMREAWKICKTSFRVWVLFSIFFVVLGGIFNVGIDIAKSETGIDSNSLPQWAWGAIIISAIMWFCKGEEIKFTFPKPTFKEWLFWTVIIFIINAIVANAPWWAVVPFYCAFGGLGGVIDDLAAKGRENHAKLKSES
jgi:hypothetical protein